MENPPRYSLRQKDKNLSTLERAQQRLRQLDQQLQQRPQTRPPVVVQLPQDQPVRRRGRKRRNIIEPERIDEIDENPIFGDEPDRQQIEEIVQQETKKDKQLSKKMKEMARGQKKQQTIVDEQSPIFKIDPEQENQMRELTREELEQQQFESEKRKKQQWEIDLEERKKLIQIQQIDLDEIDKDFMADLQEIGDPFELNQVLEEINEKVKQFNQQIKKGKIKVNPQMLNKIVGDFKYRQWRNISNQIRGGDIIFKSSGMMPTRLLEYDPEDYPLAEYRGVPAEINPAFAYLNQLLFDDNQALDFGLDTSLQTILSSHLPNLVDIFLQWEERIIDRDLVQDYDPTMITNQYLQYNFQYSLPYGNREQVRNQFVNMFSQASDDVDKQRNGLVFDIAERSQLFKDFFLNSKRYARDAFDLFSYLDFRLVVSTNSDRQELATMNQIDRQFFELYPDFQYVYNIYKKTDNTSYFQVLENLNINPGRIYRLFIFIMYMQCLGDRFFYLNQFLGRFNNQNKIYIDSGRIQPLMTNEAKLELQFVNQITISCVILQCYTLSRDFIRRGVRQLRYQIFNQNRQEVVEISAKDVYMRSVNYSKDENKWLGELGSDVLLIKKRMTDMFSSAQVTLTSKVGHLACYTRNINSFSLLQRNSNIDYITRLIDLSVQNNLQYYQDNGEDLSNARVRLDFQIQINYFHRELNLTWERLREEYVKREMGERSDFLKQIEDNEQALRTNRKPFRFNQTRTKQVQRHITGLTLSYNVWQKLTQGNNKKENIQKMILKCIGIITDEDFGELDFNEQEDVEFHESGLTETDLKDFMRQFNVKDKEIKEGEIEKLQNRYNLVEIAKQMEKDFGISVVKASTLIYTPLDGHKGGSSLYKSVVHKQLSRKVKTTEFYTRENSYENFEFFGQGNMDLSIKQYQNNLFTRIETVFFQYNCVQHIFIWLLKFYDKIDDTFEDIEINLYSEFFNNWTSFRNLETVEVTIQDIIKECQEKEIFPQRGKFQKEIKIYSDRQNIVLGNLYAEQNINFEIIVQRSHAIIVDEENFLKVEGQLQKNLIQELEIETQEILQNPQIIYNDLGIPITKEAFKEQQKDIIQNEYTNCQNLGELQNFYKKNCDKIQKVPEKNEIYIFYDIETTTRLQIALGETHKMIPYLVCAEIMMFGEPQNDLFDGSKFYFEGPHCIKRFICKIKEFMYKHIDKKFLLLAWNGRKFDSQFLIEYIVNCFPFELNLVGTVTNPKFVGINDRLELWDAMDMVSPMSLESFCKAMNVRGKNDSSLIFKVNTMQDWFNMKEEFLATNNEQSDYNMIIEYCRQDVSAMKQSIIKYNQMFKDILKEYRGDTVEYNENNCFLLEKTMAKFSYVFFTKYLMPVQMRPEPLQGKEIVQAFAESYRGGFVQSFVFGRVDLQNNNSPLKYIQYIDVNSLYPSIMAYANIPLIMSNTIEKYQPGQIIRSTWLYSVSKFHLGKNQHFGFIGVKIFDENKNFIKTIYPTKWEGHELQKKIWMYGSEINCLKFCLPQSMIKIEEFISCKREGRLFRSIEFMYQKRMQIKNENPALANAYKLLMNSLYGRFGMKAYEIAFYLTQQIIDCLSQEELEALINNRVITSLKKNKEILKRREIKLIQEENKLIKYRLEKENDYTPVSLPQRLKHIASFIANQARCRLLATLYQVKRETNVVPLYCDTDSIFYGARTLDELESIKRLETKFWQNELSSCSTVKFGNNLGYMKEEIDMKKENIVQFQVFGPKFYRYKVKDLQSGKEHWVIKSKGINQNLKTEQDVELNKTINQLRQEQFFEYFEKQLVAEQFQLQIRSAQGSVSITPLIKQNKYNYTRKIIQSDYFARFCNLTVPFEDTAEYIQFKKKNVKFNLQQKYQYE